MKIPRISAPLGRFAQDRSGAVTAEFVIIFPVVIALLAMLALVSLLLSATSDVQQVAHELARKSFRHLSAPNPPQDVCQVLRDQDLSLIVAESLLLRPAALHLPPCPGQPDASGRITITVEYEFGGDLVHRIGQSFGLSIGRITRSSVTFL